MSDEPKPYNQLYIQAWTLLSLIVAAVFFIALLCGKTFLHAGHVVWDLIRWLASPII